jgi:hypothetical protein
MKLNSVAVVHKRTIPTERPPLVGEVSANLCGWTVLRGQNLVGPGIETWTSGSVARNSEH